MGYKVTKNKKTGELKKTNLPRGISYLQREGKYRACFTDPLGKRREKTFSSQKEAENWLKIHRDSGKSFDFTPVAQSTLDDWFEYWCENISKNRRSNTMRNYRERFRINISPAIGKKPLTLITSFDCQGIINHMERVPYSEGKYYANGTIEQAFNTMRVLFKAAVKYNMIKESPVNNIEMKKYPHYNVDDMKYLTLNKHKRFLEAAQNSSNYDAFQLMLETGIRPGELIGMTFDDVDWQNRTLTIKRTAWYRNGWHIGPPKTRTGYRTIPLTQKAIDVLKNVQKRKKSICISPKADEVLTYTDEMTGRQQKIVLRDLAFFSKQTGMPMRNNAYDSCLKCVCRRAGIKEISMHDLRHTYATRCVERGMSYKSLQKLLGHSSLKVTMDLYVHVSEDSLKNAVEVFENNSNL